MPRAIVGGILIVFFEHVFTPAVAAIAACRFLRGGWWMVAGAICATGY